MKKITVLLIATVFAFNANSQVKFGLGPAVSLPTGDFSEFYSVGLGIEATAIYPISKSFEAYGSAGYHYFFGKTIDLGGFGEIKADAINHFPFLVGARYVGGKFFGGAGIGYGIYSENSGFTFSPQVGLRLSKIDLALHYTSTSLDGSNLGYFGLKSYYRF